MSECAGIRATHSGRCWGARRKSQLSGDLLSCRPVHTKLYPCISSALDDRSLTDETQHRFVAASCSRRSAHLIPVPGLSGFRHLDKMGQIATQCGQERPGKGVQRASCASARCVAATGSGTSPTAELISHVCHGCRLAITKIHNHSAFKIWMWARALHITLHVAADQHEGTCIIAGGAHMQVSCAVHCDAGLRLCVLLRRLLWGQHGDYRPAQSHRNPLSPVAASALCQQRHGGY